MPRGDIAGKRLLIAGGGTGGHIYPGLAVADAWRAAGGETAFAGVPGNLEARIVPEGGYPFFPIEVLGLTRGRSLRARMKALRALWLLITLAPLRDALRVMDHYQPDVVLGTGGYVSGPVLLAARFRRIPTMILQLDAAPGIANRILGLLATRIGVAIPEAADRFLRRQCVRHVGAPIRRAVVEAKREDGLAAFELEARRRTLLIFGGSLGSRAINEATVDALRFLGADAFWTQGCQVIHVTGRANPISLSREEASLMGLSYLPLEYCDRMPLALAAADLVVCRAGATTVAELTARGIAAILIPWQNAADNHQEANARALEREGAAKVLLDRELNGQSLAALLSSLLGDQAGIRRMAGSSRRLGIPDAAQRVAAELAALRR